VRTRIGTTTPSLDQAFLAAARRRGLLSVLGLAVVASAGALAAQAPEAGEGEKANYENFQKDWKPMSNHGQWKIAGPHEVRQLVAAAKSKANPGNTGIGRLIEQAGTMEYEWSLNMADLSKGCGFYIFGTDLEKEERGNAYLIWLTSGKDPKGGSVAVAKIVDNKFPKDIKKFPAKVEAGKWQTLRVRYDSGTGEFTLWLNAQSVGTATDPTPYKTGSCVSLTTCMTQGAYKNVIIKKVE